MHESGTLDRIRSLAGNGDVLISEHGYDEMAADEILLSDVLAGLGSGELLEDYPDAPKGPSVLVFEPDSLGRPLHVVWGIPKGFDRPAVLVTAYRPDPRKWSEDLRRRRR